MQYDGRAKFDRQPTGWHHLDKQQKMNRSEQAGEPSESSATAPVLAADYLQRVHRNKGLGTWRSLYLELLQKPGLSNYRSIAEIGAGSPEFLIATAAKRRVAVDVSDKYRAAFETAGVDFAVRDLESEDLSGLGDFDVVVCSDVFEHLLRPEVALSSIKAAMEPDGLLFSHVPNEYRLKTTLRIMLGVQEGLYFHLDQSEWADPHLRRFTDIGYRRFLGQAFQHNTKITSLRYRGIAKALHRTGLKVPFCIEGGPTYVSTDCPRKHEAVHEALGKA